MSATSVMTTLQAMMFVGTKVQGSVIESPLDLVTMGFPAVIISCPHTMEERKTTGKKREIHEIHVAYCDRWDVKTTPPPTVQALIADARVQMEIIKANLRANARLIVAGATTVEIMGDTIQTHMDGPITERNKPFAVVAIEMSVEVRDLWIFG